MALSASALGLAGVAAGVIEIGMGVAVYAVRPWQWLNRTLALLLVLEGVSFLGNFGFFYMAADESTARGWIGVATVAFLPTIPLYLIFLGQALDTPFVRPLRHPAVRVLLVSLSAAYVALWFWDSSLLVAGLYTPTYAPFEVVSSHGLAIIGIVGTASLLFAMVAAWSAWRRTAVGTPARRRARIFWAAFLVRDLGILAFSVTFASPVPEVRLAAIYAWDAVVIVFVGLLAYGILHAQLFDLDLRVRWTFRQGSLAAPFLIIFLVVSQLAEAFAARFAGGAGWALGAVAAGLLLFFVAPLQRLADRLSRAAVPGAAELEHPSLKRRLEFYEEQVRLAWEDGQLTRKDRRLLDAQRERLGIPGDAALEIESRAVARRAGRAGAR